MFDSRSGRGGATARRGYYLPALRYLNAVIRFVLLHIFPFGWMQVACGAKPNQITTFAVAQQLIEFFRWAFHLNGRGTRIHCNPAAFSCANNLGISRNAWNWASASLRPPVISWASLRVDMGLPFCFGISYIPNHEPFCRERLQYFDFNVWTWQFPVKNQYMEGAELDDHWPTVSK